MIAHTTYGEGPIHVIALHGWFADHSAFEGLLPALDPARFTIALPDYRGYGAARSSNGPFDLATVAGDALALAKDLGWDRFSLIGHSMGGKAVLRAAVEAPGAVERIVGITPVWAGAAPFDPDTLAFFRSAADSLGARQAILNLTTGERLPPHWLRTAAERSARLSTRDAFAAYLESWALDDFAEAASALPHPVLIIAGGQDRGISEEWLRASWLAHLAHARIAVLPEAGHYPMDECPLILGSTIAAFLDPQ